MQGYPPPPPARSRAPRASARGWTFEVASALVGLAALAAAAPAPGLAQDAPIEDNGWAIDVHTGPVLSSSRIVGLGGAYTALAEGIDGAPWNPASYASRTPWELSWFEPDVAFSLLLPGAFSEADFDNNGRVGLTYEDFYFLALGLRLQFGRVGMGGLARAQIFQISGGAEPIDVSLVVANFGVGYSLFDGQLVLGLGGRVATLDVGVQGGQPLVSYGGAAGVEAGVLLRLAGQPWRAGLALRSAVSTEEDGGSGVVEDPATGVRRAAGFVLPRAVHLPWELQAGFAFLIGRRPLNVRWLNPRDDERTIRDGLTTEQRRRALERARSSQGRAAALARPATAEDVARWRAEDQAWAREEEQRRQRELDGIDERLEALMRERRRWLRSLPRLYLLVSLDVLITGPTADGIGLESFLSQAVQRAGSEITFEPRLGFEAEPWPNRLKVRLGSYLEPSRFTEAGYRVHGTSSLDLRLFSWDVFGLFDDPLDFKASASADLAPRYFDWGIGVGFWH